MAESASPSRPLSRYQRRHLRAMSSQMPSLAAITLFANVQQSVPRVTDGEHRRMRPVAPDQCSTTGVRSTCYSAAPLIVHRRAALCSTPTCMPEPSIVPRLDVRCRRPETRINGFPSRGFRPFAQDYERSRLIPLEFIEVDK